MKWNGFARTLCGSRAAAGMFLLVALGVLTAGPAAGQATGALAGSVTTEAGAPLRGAMVSVAGYDARTFTGEGGAYRLELPAGTHEVRVTLLGYGNASRTVRVAAGEVTRVAFTLEERPVELTGMRISVLRPDMRPQDELEEREVREANPRDVGEALRVLPGVDAVRRGPLGLDPVVRGLRETEVGVYVDGTRQFPAGPGRMDAALTHVDPTALRSVQVVKGPYALTWGAGNMGAIRVETQAVPPTVPGAFRGRFLTGYDTNLQATETAATLYGSQDRLAYWLHGAWREGDDYETGGEVVVPAGYLSREVRGKLGYRVAPESWLAVSGGYQSQDDLDYPGRMLDAAYFHAWNLNGRWNWEPATGTVRSVEAMAYVNRVDHLMDNDDKPTAQPMEGRTPPFAIDVEADTWTLVHGGRVAGLLEPSAGWQVEVGADLYRANRNAERTIARRDNGMIMSEDLMWPDATILDAGAFLRGTRTLGRRSSVTGTVRLDHVRANADTASPFFLDNVATDLDATETNLSGSLVASTGVSEHWTVSAGIGSVVRTADATERYSDRISSSKAQTSAEFVGNPALDPERSTQADVWLEGSYSGLAVSLNAFARRVDDYITLEGTDLPARLPMSPPTVYRYVNGEAVFWGGEAVASYRVLPSLTLGATASYLEADDRTLDEPLLGVSPARGSARVRWQPTERAHYLEATVRAAADQERVSESRGEFPTDGYTTLDLQGGFEVPGGVLLRAGVNNLTDEAYINHLNTRNPFTGAQVPEPGRVFFVRLSYAF